MQNPAPSEALGLFAGAVGALSLVALLVNVTVWVQSDELPNAVLRLAADVCLLLLSAGLVALWRGGVATRTLLRAGLGYQLLGALCLALPEYLGEYFLDGGWGRLLWLPLWIVALPCVVPAHPAKHALISLASAAAPGLLYWSWLASEDMFAADAAALTRAGAPLIGAALLSVGSAAVGRRLARPPERGLGSV